MRYRAIAPIYLAVLLLLPQSIFCLEGPDFMLIGDYYIPRESSFNIASIPYERTGFIPAFSNASLYGISSLNWLYGGARVFSKSWSAAVFFRDYGIKGLYSSTVLSVLLQKSIWRKASLAVGYSHNAYVYGDRISETSRQAISLGAGWRFRRFNLSISADNLSFKKDNGRYADDPEIIISGFWQADEDFAFHLAYYRDRHNSSRFLVGQNIELARPLNINIGFLSNPEIYFAGLEVVYKRFVFGYTFYDTGGLPDCSRITLSFR